MFVLSFLVLLLAEPDTGEGVRSPERPVVPNVTALSSTEIRITWCRVNSNKVEIDHYELFIDTELEYSGIDVMYIAKRLKPWSWYEVKLRACGFSPGSCSPFSRPALVKTLRDGDNTTTVIESGVTIFKVIVVPTYMFILGMIAGVLAISFVLIWRYLQCMDLSGGSAFELPQYLTTANKEQYSALITQQPPDLGNNPLSSLESTPYFTKAAPVDNTESHYLEIVPSKVENLSEENRITFVDYLSPSLYLMSSAGKGQGLLPKEQAELHMESGHSETAYKNYSQTENLKDDGMSSLNEIDNKDHKETGCGRDKSLFQLHERTEVLTKSTPTNNNVTTPLCQAFTEQPANSLEASYKGSGLFQSPSPMYDSTSDLQSHFIDQEVTTGVKTHSSLFPNDGMVVAIDNSNIYIGAQECASMVNAGDRKRHVRVKLQNLVRILEKERMKIRGFACGSSPPATEYVWEVYRRLGYVVDLEDRRGKDEQRVDEGLHLWIYKALCELPPGVLVLATGDGMKGKSECDTSFPRCAVTALERGWTVEVYSWKHSLSSEWIKLTKKHPERLTINYLDRYVNYITFVDGKYGRKCSPLPYETEVLKT